MPITPVDHRHAAGRFHARRPVLPPTPRPLDTGAIRQVESGPQALAALLLVSNAAVVPTNPASLRVSRNVAGVAQTRVACPYAHPSLAGVLHGAAGLLRNPVTALVSDVRDGMAGHQGRPCPPPLSAGMRALLQAGDAAAEVAELAVVGPRGVSAIQLVADALDAGADALEHRPPDPDLVMSVLQGQAGMRLDTAGVGPAPADARAAQGPRMAIAQTTVELREGRVLVRLDGADQPLSISGGQLQVRTDAGNVPVRWDATRWEWMRLPAGGQVPGATGRTESSIPLFDATAEQIHTQAPLDNVRLRVDLLGPDGLLYYQDPASGRVGNAVCVDGRYYAATLEPPQGLRIGTLALERQDGFYAPRREPATRSTAVRCRRAPGAACVPAAPQFSVGLSRILRHHHARGLSEAQARHRGIVADPSRPGWHLSRNGGRQRHYLQFNGRFFRVRTRQLDGYTQRLSVYLPRAAGAGRLSGWGRVAHRIADIQPSLPAHGQRWMTQAEFNVEYRGMPSLEAAQVYESAIQHIGGLHLTQLQRAAIRNYLLRRRSVDEFLLSGGVLPPVFNDATQVVARIRRGLARIPPHAGRVYAALALDAAQLAALEAGQVVYSESFLVASGDRGRAVSAAARAADGPQAVSTVLSLDMHQHAHPTGLISLQDEAQVLIGNNVLFKVIARSTGELHLEEMSAARQAMGTLGAQALRAVPLRG